MLLKACMVLRDGCCSLCNLENLEHSHPGSVRSGVTWLTLLGKPAHAHVSPGDHNSFQTTPHSGRFYTSHVLG